MIDREKLQKLSEISLSCEVDEIPYEGNASAIDDATDAETNAWIAAELARGNGWAWCCVTVATYAGISERSVLGACSYESEAAFRADQYEQMVSEAVEGLAQRLEDQLLKIASATIVDGRAFNLPYGKRWYLSAFHPTGIPLDPILGRWFGTRTEAWLALRELRQRAEYAALAKVRGK